MELNALLNSINPNLKKLSLGFWSEIIGDLLKMKGLIKKFKVNGDKMGEDQEERTQKGVEPD